MNRSTNGRFISPTNPNPMSKTITLTEEEYAKIKHLIEVDETKNKALEDYLGKNVFIRSVTMYYTGHVEAIVGTFIVLSSAAWIADTGRFADFLKSGKASEVEPMGDTMVNIGAILDISPLQTSLPLEQK